MVAPSSPACTLVANVQQTLAWNQSMQEPCVCTACIHKQENIGASWWRTTADSLEDALGLKGWLSSSLPSLLELMRCAFAKLRVSDLC